MVGFQVDDVAAEQIEQERTEGNLVESSFCQHPEHGRGFLQVGPDRVGVGIDEAPGNKIGGNDCQQAEEREYNVAVIFNEPFKFFVKIGFDETGFRRITDEHGLAERVDVNRQTHRCHRLRDHQIPETAGYVPVKFVAVFIVPQFAVEHIVKFVGINARLQFKLFLGRDQVAVAGVFQPVGNFGAVDAHAVKIRDGRVFDPVAGNGIFRQRF